MRLNQESPVAPVHSNKLRSGKCLALGFALLGLALQSCDRAATRPVEESVATEDQTATELLGRTAASAPILPTVDRFTSQQSDGNLANGFKADASVRWLWGGCTSFLVINDQTKDLLLIDAYVDKSTLGNNHFYPVGLLGRKRVARYVNQIRGLVAQGYTISGILMTHGHGDHAGDLRYILSGIKMPSKNDFMQTGIALTGKAYSSNLKVYMNTEARNSSIEYMVASGDYDSYVNPVIDTTKLAPVGLIYNKPFKVGAAFTYGTFSITPYIWYHGKIDGTISLNSPVRTIAYGVKGLGYSNPATVFVTGSYIEKSDQVKEVNANIPAHHLLFADGGDDITAMSAMRINLLPNPPTGANYIIPTHNDNNSNYSLDMTDNRDEALGLYSRLVKLGIVNYWQTTPHTIKLGYFANRLGD